MEKTWESTQFKINEKFWLLATFESNDKKELKSSEKRIILQTYCCWCQLIIFNKSYTLASEIA